MSSSTFFLAAFLFPALAAAYTFNFDNTPTQCGSLSLSIVGAGTPPYSVLIIPFGPSPLPNGTEVRKITQQAFSDNTKSLSFQLPFPAHSQFIAVVSDKTGFGTGGSSSAATVQASNDASCFDPKTQVQPDFVFNISPFGAITQCSPTRLWWDPSLVQGTPTFQGIIPGGQSFSVPQGELTNQTGEGLGFPWTPSVRAGTTLILVGGDGRGPGTAGSTMYIVNPGLNSCLNDQSPSSTPGSPAGGSYPTGTSVGSSGGGGGSTNVGAIVGGVIGGVAGLVALVLFLLFLRRRQQFHQSKNRPDLLREGDDEDGQPNTTELPRYYEPEPFVVPDPTIASSEDPTMMTPPSIRPSQDGRRLSYVSTEIGRASTPDQSASASGYMRKSAVPAPLRPVNILQHEDAGPGDEPETIELPPAYTHIKRAVVTNPDPTDGEGSGSGQTVAARGTAQARSNGATE